MARVRHCVVCPNCQTRYLPGFSPYDNGSYVVPTIYGSSAEYMLYCACEMVRVVSRWRWSETIACEVSKEAYKRGYGSPEEVSAVQKREEWQGEVVECDPRVKRSARHAS